jgi:glutaredoxin
MNKSKWMICLAAGMWLAIACSGSQKGPPAAPVQPPAAVDAGGEEPEAPHAEIIAFILNRCPYAAEAMRSLLALKREMGDAIDLSVGYIGLLDADGGIDPSIGAPEIAAARMQICVGITADDVEWLDYLECVYEGDRWRSMPDGFDECARRTSIDRDQVLDCIDSGAGDEILAQAYGAATGSRIVSSPTIIIDGHLYGGPRDIAFLKQYVCYAAGSPETLPRACANVAPPPEIAATMLYDQRCDDAELCDAEAEIAVLQKLVPGLSLVKLPFDSEAGRKMYDLILKTGIGVRDLPMVVVDGGLDQHAWVVDLFGESLMDFGDGHLIALGRGWDPLKEICDNEIDDNDDGEADCLDETCSETLICRKEEKYQLDFFIMSGCPFATQMMPSVDQLLAHFEKNREEINLRLQFIGDVDGEELFSMHGPEEVAEDLRMICAQALYGKRYKFMEYVLCRAEETDSPAWEACVPKGMSKKKLEKCATGKDGKALLKDSFELASRLGVNGSPTLIVNNKHPLNARQFQAMLEGFCEKNESAHCSKPASSEDEEAEPTSELKCE